MLLAIIKGTDGIFLASEAPNTVGKRLCTYYVLYKRWKRRYKTNFFLRKWDVPCAF
jgi:hypothetical protein